MDNITPTQQMIASSSGAVITSLFVTPLDVVKIRMQSQNTNAKCFLYCNGLMDHLCYCLNGNGNGGLRHKKWYRRPSPFNSTFHGMVQIARTEGVPSLWSGLSPTLIMAVPATVMYFTAYDHFRDYLIKHSISSKEIAPVVAGATARAATVSVISPLELVRTKMQSQKLSGKDIRAAVKSTIKVGGFQKMWIGLGPTLMRDVPFSMIYWYLLEELKRIIEIKSVFLKSFVCGLMAGMTAGIITLPLDVVKTKRQITLGELELRGVNGREATTTLAVMRKIVRESGYRGLFVGLIPRCAKIAPACAIMIGSYDFTKSFFKKRNDRKTSQPPPSPDKIPAAVDKTLTIDKVSSTFKNSSNI